MIDPYTTNFSDLPPIMAVDFDGTLVEDEFPKIGKERKKLCHIIRQLQTLGVKSILWTSRTGTYLEEAIEWCQNHDLCFDTINENLPEVLELTGGEDTRKVYANIYIDDRSCSASEHLSVWNSLEELMEWFGK